MSEVIAMLACPRISMTPRICTPWASRSDAQVYRMSWKRIRRGDLAAHEYLAIHDADEGCVAFTLDDLSDLVECSLGAEGDH